MNFRVWFPTTSNEKKILNTFEWRNGGSQNENTTDREVVDKSEERKYTM